MALVSFSKNVLPFLIMLTTITGELITFELHDSRLNEVIFPGDLVVLKCETTIDINRVVNIRILHTGSMTVVESVKDTSNVTHIIKEASLNDSGNYTCIVTYDAITLDPKQLLSNNLFLNVQEERPQCFHNGTDSPSFQVGDVLSITCYCYVNDTCHWTQFIEGSSKASIVASNGTIYGEKVIKRAVVGPLTEMDNNVKFFCFYGGRITQRCGIGPLIHKSKENGLLIPTNMDYTSLAATPFSYGTSSSNSKQSTVGIPKSEFQNYLPWLVLGVAFVTAIFLASLTCVSYFFKTKRGYDVSKIEERDTSKSRACFNSAYKTESQHDELCSSNFKHTNCPEVPVQDFILSVSIKGDYAEVNERKIPSLPLSKTLGVSHLQTSAEEEVLYAKIDKKKQIKYRNHFDNASNDVQSVRTISPPKDLEKSQINKASESLQIDQEGDSQQVSDNGEVSKFHPQPEKEELYAKVNKGRQRFQSRNHQNSDVWNKPRVLVMDDSDYAEVY